MAWVKLDDQFTEHPKIDHLSDAAFRLHVAGLCYCGRHLTDGHIPKVRVQRLLPKVARRAVDELVSAGLWMPANDGYRVKDFLQYNPSAEKVKAGQEYRRRSRELHGDPALVQAIRKRDGNHCRYCSIKVNWSDRRGPSGATYDHVDPQGPNVLANVVVACRGCNSSKRGRTPEEAGMFLRPAPDLNPDPNSIQPPSRPDPSRPEGSRDGVSEEPSARRSSPAPSGGDDTPDTTLPPEQVERNVSHIRSIRGGLRGEQEAS
jgi:hypothetical protein